MKNSICTLLVFFSFSSFAETAWKAPLKKEVLLGDDDNTLYYYASRPCTNWNLLQNNDPYGYVCSNFSGQVNNVPEVHSLIKIIRNLMERINALEERAGIQN